MFASPDQCARVHSSSGTAARTVSARSPLVMIPLSFLRRSMIARAIRPRILFAAEIRREHPTVPFRKWSSEYFPHRWTRIVIGHKERLVARRFAETESPSGTLDLLRRKSKVKEKSVCLAKSFPCEDLRQVGIISHEERDVLSAERSSSCSPRASSRPDLFPRTFPSVRSVQGSPRHVRRRPPSRRS